MIEIGFLPGVTDNIAHTVKETIVDLFHLREETKLEVYTFKKFLISGFARGRSTVKRTIELEDAKKLLFHF